MINLNPFETKCINTECGATLKRGVNFCHKCGKPQDAATTTCGNCQSVVSASAKFCPKCGANLAATARPVLRDHHWARGGNDFATRVDVGDVKGFLKQELIVEPGTQALLIINGESRGVFPPGKYTVDTIGDKLARFIALEQVRTVTAVLVSASPIDLNFQSEKLFTSDPLTVGIYARVVAEVENPAVFSLTLMKGRNNLTVNDLANYLKSDVAILSEEWVKSQTVDGLASETRLKDEYALHLEEGLQRRFKSGGLAFKDVQAIRFVFEQYDQLRQKKEEFVLQTASAQVELEGRRRYAAAKHDLDLQKLTEQTKEVEVYEERAKVMARMHTAVLSEKLSELKTEEELDTYLREQDKRKFLADKEIEDLKRAWAEERQDKDRARAHILAKLDVERKYELQIAQLRGERAMVGEKMDIELEVARKKADFEYELKRKEWDEQLKVEADKQRIARERAALQVEIERLQRQQDRDDAMLGMELLAKMKEIKRLDEEERLRIQREHQLEMQKVEDERRTADFDREMRKVAEEHRHELAKIEQISKLSVEALISISPKEQAAILADFKRAESFKGMSDEQIMALVAERSPIVAEALKEKYRAMNNGQLSENERKLYERLATEKDKNAAEMLRQMREMSDKQAEIAKEAMLRMSEMSRNQPASQVVMTPSSSQPMIMVDGKMVQGSTATTRQCPQCGITVERSVAFCPECGHKFPGGK